MLMSNSSDNDLILVNRLVREGNIVAIIDGRLSITKVNGEPVLSGWGEINKSLIITTIVKHLKLNVYKYKNYTTGFYGSRKSEGITLQFENIITGESTYVIFNANLKRIRTSKYGKKGEALPGKQFSVTTNYKFYSFWRSTYLPLPKRLSGFYDCMGRLKQLIFTGSIDNRSRFIDKDISLLNVPHSIIYEVFSGQVNDIINKVVPDSFTTKTLQVPDNALTTFPDKHYQGAQLKQEGQTNPSTCSNNYGNKFIRKYVTKESVAKVYEDNEREIPLNISKSKKEIKTPQEQTVDEWLDDWEATPNLPNASGKSDEELDRELKQLI